jgi:membrane-associated phospholipid phosphatase
MTALLRHVRALWPRWALLPVLPFWAFGLFRLARGELRVDHVALMLGIPLLAYGNQKTKRLLVGCYPVPLVGLFYDAMKLVQNVGVRADSVHVCDLRGIELRLFGITVEGERMTLHDWFQTRSVPALDLYCAIPYGTFIFVSIGFAIFLYFKDFSALTRFAWSFFALNVAGFITYHIYPAAPPWYFHTHGCVVDVLARASEGPNLRRVDEMLGVSYFAGMYGRSSDVFGAVPSLHVAYPLLIVLVGWRRMGLIGRVIAILFLVSMCFAAVYLDHHWVVDVVVGLFYCVVTLAVVSRIQARLARPRPTVCQPQRQEGVA